MSDSDVNPYEPQQSKNILSHVFNWHTTFHIGLMITGMVVPVVGLAAAKIGASATLGDVFLGAADMAVSMVQNTIESLPVLGDVASNTISGDIAPRAYEWGMMDHGTHLASADGVGHAVHGAADVDPNWTADKFSDLYDADDAPSLKNLMEQHPT